MNKKEMVQETFTGERALFHAQNMKIVDSTFEDGESPLKESKDIDLVSTRFKWKYPLWYAQDIHVQDGTWFEMARSGVWYTKRMLVEDSMIDAPKNFRRCQDLTLNNVTFSNAQETLWNCTDVRLNNVVAKGDYFGMGSENVYVDGLTLYGNYCFDGAKNVEVHHAKLMSKDAFWNCENVVIYDSIIYGEYLAWNAKNITFINCKIESLQGLCYIEDLVMKHCTLINTTLAFEYCSVDAQIDGTIDSILNPSSGRIQADVIKDIRIEEDKVDPRKTEIICGNDGFVAS